MEEESKQIRILIAAALFLAALLIGYNAFFIPDVSSSFVVTDQQDAVSSSTFSDKSSASGKLDLNTATQEDLDSLDGIGPVLASRIVAYRQENGPFRSVDDLKKVSGIGEKTLEKLKNFLIVFETVT